MTPTLLRAAAALAPHVSRYGLVLVIGWIGLFKFTPTEAAGIEPLVRNSPVLAWMYEVMSVRAVSGAIGSIELAIALLIALRPVAPRLSAAGSLGAVVMFLTTLSFLFTTPGTFRVIDGLFVPAGGGQFLLKDTVLLGAALWTAAEAGSVRRHQASGSGAGPDPERPPTRQLP